MTRSRRSLLPGSGWLSRWFLLGWLILCSATAPAELLLFRSHTTLPVTGSDEVAAAVASTVTLPGRLLDPPVVIEPGEAPYQRERSPLNTSKALWEAFIADDEAEILRHWARADRRLLRTVLADQEVRALNRRLLRAHQRKRIFGVVELQIDQPYRLLLVRYDEDPPELGQVEAYVLEDGAWKATNAVVESDQFDTVWKAFRSGEVSAIRHSRPERDPR